jgi:hypothetical protein
VAGLGKRELDKGKGGRDGERGGMRKGEKEGETIKMT